MSSHPVSGARQRVHVSKTPSRAPSISSKPALKRQPKPPYELTPVTAFYIFFASHFVAALYSPIQDCDEVFNYWEPTHYLTHGHAFQTWEYSPQFALRSWTYAGVHALVTLLARPLSFLGQGKPAEFYFLRIAFALVCALCEARLFSKIAAVLNPRIAVTFLIVMASSPGMYHASVAYLPSSFAMYFTMLGSAAFMDWRGGLGTAQGIFCFATGAVLGWPFAAALVIPFLSEELLLASLSDEGGRIQFFWRIVDGAVRTLIVLVLQAAIEWFFYKKWMLLPLNIVLYNVFGSKGGPDLYGTEPWHFYLRNLFLNFHLWFLLAMISMPLLLAQQLFRTKGATKSSYLRGIVFLSPFYLWLAIFTFQPHKEERFMYPAYPALALNAAVAMHILLANLGSTDPKDVTNKIPLQLRFIAILGLMLTAFLFSLYRTVGTMTAFGAPLSIYKPLHAADMTRAGDTVCLGKEWYRFPSHHLLPDGVRAKFIRSEFSGLLPGEFSEAKHGFGLFPGTWLIPPGMNDENREDVGKYTDVKHCDFLIDSSLPSTIPTKLEPNFVNDSEVWEKIKCLPFMDAASTHIIGRLGWVPDLPIVPAKYRRVSGDYCLLRRRKKPVIERRMNLPSIETLQ